MAGVRHRRLAVSEAKGYGEKSGLVTGIVLSVLARSSGPSSAARDLALEAARGPERPGADHAHHRRGRCWWPSSAYFVATIDASGGGRIGLVAVVLMVLVIAAALVFTIDIQRATGGKTMAELRTERAAD